MLIKDMISCLYSLQDTIGDKEVWLVPDIRSVRLIIDLDEFRSMITYYEEKEPTQKDEIMGKFDELIKMIKDLK
jgi:hypothetical protein